MGNAFLSTHATFVQLSVMSLLDNQKIDDGIRHWVKMIHVKSGKKVVVRTRIPILYSECRKTKENTILHGQCRLVENSP